jgi:hypothetical protein
MKALFFAISVSILFVSCRINSIPPDDSQFSTNLYNLELTHIDSLINNYFQSKNDEKLKSQYLAIEDKISSLEETLTTTGKIKKEEQEYLFNICEKTFNNYSPSSLKKFESLKEFPITKVSDIYLFNLFIKQYFLRILEQPIEQKFNVFSPMFSAPKWDIKEREEFTVDMGIMAYNYDNPPKWYIIKNVDKGLEQDNILDSLSINDNGKATFNTKKYKKGENIINVVSIFHDQYGREQSMVNGVSFNVH